MGNLLEEFTNQTQSQKSQSTPSKLPKGVVLDKDGKPCRTCTSTSAWLSMMKQSTNKPSSSTTNNNTASSMLTAAAAAATATAATTTEDSLPQDCPPDVEELGRSSWTLLHSLTASYPTHPTPTHQTKTAQFIALFSQLYPCWVCAEDFQEYIARPENEVQKALKSQEEFGQWMCRAHNEVNRKLGKKEFDCGLWRERWKDGWRDGRCG